LDTKLRKSKPFLAWGAFFLGLSLLLALSFLGVMNLQNMIDYRHDIGVFLVGDYKESHYFKENIATQLQIVTRQFEMYLSKNTFNTKSQIEKLKGEGDNLLYWSYNSLAGIKLTNMSQEPIFNDNKYTLPEGYDYYLYFDGQKLWACLDNKTIDVYDYQDGYRGIIDEEFFSDEKDYAPLSQNQILLAVKRTVEPIPNATSQLYQNYKRFLAVRWLLYGMLFLALLSLVLLVIAIVKRESKRAFDRKIAQILSHLWLEVKIILYPFAGFAVFAAIKVIAPRLSNELVEAATALGVLWLIYILIIDLFYNRRQFFTHNFPNWLIERYRLLEKGRPFKKALLMRVMTLLLVEIALMVLAVILPLVFRHTPVLALIIFCLFVALGVYLLYRYLKQYNQNLDHMERIVDHIERMREGDWSSELTLPDDSDFYSTAQSLNLIQEGIARATEERLKSERMKVELITNVSHDLKTPLTSIISYVELLASEENLPDQARDYVSILSQKSEKLKSLIQDIFDLSKATSGAIELDKEILDISKLVRQTLADMEEEAEKTGLSFKTRFPEIPVHIIGDGRKLYRVFQNLMTNIFKYSLEGSRVYIDVTHDSYDVTVTLKNIANYEMNFLETEVTERFVRGDKSRSTEGSGLGLAIAKSYVEAMGGSLRVRADGDLFKVEITFPIHWQKEALE
jgi:signal transduction histidine kinase